MRRILCRIKICFLFFFIDPRGALKIRKYPNRIVILSFYILFWLCNWTFLSFFHMIFMITFWLETIRWYCDILIFLWPFDLIFSSPFTFLKFIFLWTVSEILFLLFFFTSRLLNTFRFNTIWYTILLKLLFLRWFNSYKTFFIFTILKTSNRNYIL